ncbi:MAG: hypothetical protein ACJAV2_002769 [Myxococcota bacterium]
MKQLVEADLSPTELYADMGYGSGANIVACAELGVDLQAPVRDPKTPEQEDKMGEPVQAQTVIEPPSEADTSEDAPPSSETEKSSTQQDNDVQGTESTEAPPDEEVLTLTLGNFTFGADFKTVLRCPTDKEPVSQHLDGAQKKIWARFSRETCEGCPLAQQCPTRRLKSGGRTLQTSVRGAATKIRQREQQTREFRERYKIRSGIESTNAEMKSRHGAGSLRIRGKKRVEMSMQMKAAAVNVKRATFWHAAQERSALNERMVSEKIASLRESPEPPVEAQLPPAPLESPEPPPAEEVVGVSWLARLTYRLLEPLRAGATSPFRRMPVVGAAFG